MIECMKHLASLMTAILLAACNPAPAPTPANTASLVETATQVPPTMTAAPTSAYPTLSPTLVGSNTDSGLTYIELRAGDGPSPESGNVVTVNYLGKLEGGRVFADSYKEGQPIRFVLGKKQAIAGLEEGVARMKKGGKARLIIPPELAYGARGLPGLIPPEATLTFEIELLEVQPGSPAKPQAVDPAYYIKKTDGLKYYDLKEGDGAYPQAGQTVVVHFTGWLADGTKIDSSIDRGVPLSFTFGLDRILRGWEEGLATMRVGGVRQLVIPPELGYGTQGLGSTVPPNATLIFEIQLLAAR